MAEYKETKITGETISKNFRYARKKWRAWMKEAAEDFDFLHGLQWKDEDKETLEKAGVPALTINKIQPLVFWLRACRDRTGQITWRSLKAVRTLSPPTW